MSKKLIKTVSTTYLRGGGYIDKMQSSQKNRKTDREMLQLAHTKAYVVIIATRDIQIEFRLID